MFEELREENSSIIVGDNRDVAVTGRGSVKLRLLANGCTNILTLNNVALVPDLGINLVSTGRLESQGLRFITENGVTQVNYKDELIGVARRKNSNPYLYEFDLASKDKVLVAKPSKKVSWTIWHKRLAHLSGNYMSKLKSSDTEQPTERVFCEDCQLCKAKKLPHKTKSQSIINEEKISGIRKGVIHSDLMGPMKIKSLSGSRYVLTYICGHTEFSFVYLLKSKSEQFSFFKEFKAMYEKQSGLKIKELRSDNGSATQSNTVRQS